MGRLAPFAKNGGRIILDLAMTLVRDYRTRMASVVCTGRDITDESELRAELRDARKMDAIGTVASGVAHDFNNLLMVISAYAELGATDTLLRSSLAPELAGDIVRFAKSGGLDAADAGIGPRADAGSTFGEPEFYCGRHLPVASSSDWGGRRTVRFAGEGRWVH